MFLDPIRISSFECESSLIFGVSRYQLCSHRLQMLLERHLSCYHDNESAKYFSLSFGGHVRFSEFSFFVYSHLEVMIVRVAICTLYLSSIYFTSLYFYLWWKKDANYTSMLVRIRALNRELTNRLSYT